MNVQDNYDRGRNAASNPEPTNPAPLNSVPTYGMELYSYINLAASSYADDNWNIIGQVPSAIRNKEGWNLSWPTNSKDNGLLDCTNFVSQAVYEGVSCIASDRNYFFPDPSHYNDWWYYKFSTEVDGSQPWVNVGEFYEFLTLNYYNYLYYPDYTIRGPARYGIDLCYIQLGDVIFMYAGSEWQHTVIVDQIGTYTCGGNTVYVAAHSTDAYRRPLYEYSGYIWYPVRIAGYLDEKHFAFLPIAFNGSESMGGYGMQNPYPLPESTNQQLTPSSNPYPQP